MNKENSQVPQNARSLCDLFTYELSSLLPTANPQEQTLVPWGRCPRTSPASPSPIPSPLSVANGNPLRTAHLSPPYLIYRDTARLWDDGHLVFPTWPCCWCLDALPQDWSF